MIKQEFKRSEIVIETPVYRLHHFNTGTGVPIFVLPPHAGRHGCITQRLIDKCVGQGRTVYAFELLPATRKTANTSISDLLSAISECHNHIGEIIDLVAVCQGGWLGAIYAAKHPESINKLAAFAAPFNCKTGEDNCIENYMKTPFILDYQRMMVAMNGGIQPGYMQWLAFSMVKPEFVYFDRWTDMQKMVWSGDDKGLEKWKKNNAWYDSPQNIAGTWFIESLKHHFRDNDLFEGRWVIDGEAVDLSRIKCPVWLYAGSADEITHQKQVFDLEYKVSGPVTKILFEGAGHTKVFVGTQELEAFKDTFLSPVWEDSANLVVGLAACGMVGAA